MKPGGARMKGQDGEREVIKLLEPHVGKLQRNLDQTRDGGHDILGLGKIALEVKRQETLDVENWWKQTMVQAGEDKIPVLIYRQSRQPWRVIMWVKLDDLKVRATISFEDFVMWLNASKAVLEILPENK